MTVLLSRKSDGRAKGAALPSVGTGLIAGGDGGGGGSAAITGIAAGAVGSGGDSGGGGMPPLIEVVSSTPAGDEDGVAAAPATAAIPAVLATGQPGGNEHRTEQQEQQQQQQNQQHSPLELAALEGEIDWELEQPLPTPQDTVRLGQSQGAGYGFDSKYSNVLGKLMAEIPGQHEPPSPRASPRT